MGLIYVEHIRLNKKNMYWAFGSVRFFSVLKSNATETEPICSVFLNRKTEPSVNQKFGYFGSVISVISVSVRLFRFYAHPYMIL